VFERIPVVDLAVLDGVRLGERLVEVYGSVGFGYIVGHGVPEDLVAEVFEQSQRFHALPAEAKAAIELNALHRGYIPINASTDVTSVLATVTRPNQSESFMMMREAGPDDPAVLAGHYLAGPNQWPDLPGFRETLAAYHDALVVLSQRLVEALAATLGDTEGVVARSFRPATTWLRLLRYPIRPPDAPDDLYGSAPHVDFGGITVLAQDQRGGLQVATPDGRWVDAPPLPGSFVVNVGTMLHRWSNGRLLATPHRVINTSGAERYSVPFFYDPDVTARVEPLACCIGADRPALFEPLVFGDFVRRELESGYRHHQPDPSPSRPVS
jgi:isopenicillin N synthase-like dioxygenase